MSSGVPVGGDLGVTYDRAALGVGIVHFGVGNFHRSHEAMYIDRLARLGLAQGWGICGVGVLSFDVRMRDALRSQDLTYTLMEEHPDGQRSVSTIGSIVEYLYAPDELDAVLERLADPATRIVSLTITEGGYNISDASGEFDAANPAIQADIRAGARPQTVFGIVVAGLALRRERGIAPFTIMSCDNIEENGRIARTSFSAYADLVDAELGEWLRAEVSFPSSMVDRITPVTTDEHRRIIRDEYGVDDAWPVVSESFEQWVVEDRFPLGRPPLDHVGVQFVDDVRPYELMKLRLLNGSHQALAYFGMLRGIEFVHDAAQQPAVADAVRRYMAEAEGTLEPVPGVDLALYQRTLIERFQNPHIRDTLARLATDGSDRIPKFVVPVLRARRKAGLASRDTVAVIAAWARYLALARAESSSLPFSDRQAREIDDALIGLDADPGSFLRADAWFGDLAGDNALAAEFAAAYHAMQVADISRMTAIPVIRADFPNDFVWGTATASYQIEGSPNADGKGASIWDAYVATHGTINDGTTGDVANDHYVRFREDVRLMAEMGMESYRFSISWPRIQADGTGPANLAGIAFYRALCEELRAHGIRPWVTLYHWDLPLALEEQGGWLVRETADRFAEYARLVAEELGDLVEDWITLNEPWCSSFVGYGSGGQAPGRRLGAEAGKAAHHLLVAHGLAVDAIRSAVPGARVGITLNLSPVHSRTDSAADRDVARAVDGIQNRLFLDPVLTGGYPSDVVERLGLTEWVAERSDEVALITRPLDFLGVNYYFPVTVAAGDTNDEGDGAFPIGAPARFFHGSASRTAMGWPIRPDVLGEMLQLVTDRDPDIDIVITENGAAFDDQVAPDGAVHDEERTAYLQAHFAAARDAIRAGAKLRGYFVWSFMDNFEWSWGLARRFGIVRVDHATQQRTVKDSGRWYSSFLRGA